MSQHPHGGPVQPALPQRPAATQWPNDLDLLLVILGSLIAGIAFALEWPLWLRLPIGLVATLALPGYAVSMALLPPGKLDGVERSALAFSLSIGVIVLIAPFVNMAPGGLTERAIVVAVSAITSVATAAAWWRRGDTSTADQAIAGSSIPAVMRSSHVSRRLGAFLLGLLALASVALVSGEGGAPPPAGTEFFLLPADGTTAGVPSRVVVGTPTTIAVAIANHEGSEQDYTVVVESDSERLARTAPVSVKPGTFVSARVTFSLSSPGIGKEVRILLFRGSDDQPYRSLRLLMDVALPASTTPSSAERQLTAAAHADGPDPAD